MTLDLVIRPGAVIDDRAARKITDWLALVDVAKGGKWVAGTNVWQRFDQPWNGEGGMRGTAQHVGSIFITYNTPANYYVTLHRVTISEVGARQGWTVDKLADEVLHFADLTLETCPRDESLTVVSRDPFKTQRNAQVD
ncbi:MAG: hypothetical protein JWM40_1838 [Frankiales bacterium]|nr:hypothetical protein [Frankiales bacterium]